MPIYEYACQNCGQEFEHLIRGDEKPVCPSCGGEQLSRQFSVPAAHSGGSTPGCPMTGGKAEPDNCGMQDCCGQRCGMSEWQ
jgi:putative FmdB family regulatory protein